MSANRIIAFWALTLVAACLEVRSQVEVAPWANAQGIRIHGELVPFETAIAEGDCAGNKLSRSRHYGLEPHLRRDGSVLRSESAIGGVAFRQQVTDREPGVAHLSLDVSAAEGLAGKSGFFSVAFLSEDYPSGVFSFYAEEDAARPIAMRSIGEEDAFAASERIARVELRSERRSVVIELTSPLALVLRKTREGGSELLFRLLDCGAAPGETARFEALFRVAAEPDRRPVKVTVDATRPGRRFDGVGGNFRLQFPDTDPQVIDYCLENLPVKWGRIGMWWNDWHPIAAEDPIARARGGDAPKRIYEQSRMAQRLAAAGMPVIVSAWFPPEWATLPGQKRPGTYGVVLDGSRWADMADSIARYLVYLKEDYGVEAVMFSFNEPDIGVQVAQTPEEHVAMITLFGRRFVAAGLSTKLLLADTSNATPKSLEYARRGLSSADARPYIGGVGFHTWGGCERENLVQWSAIAGQLQVPLLVTESGPDSEAHRNPQLFLEPSYQQQEIDLYVRLCADAQPASIMQWQLTADYSLLAGGGVYGDNDRPLAPTRRFWNFKQLSLTPEGSSALPVSIDGYAVVSAAFGDKAKGRYAVHLVNNGAARRFAVGGLPADAAKVEAFATDDRLCMDSLGTSLDPDGSIAIELPDHCFATILVHY